MRSASSSRVPVFNTQTPATEACRRDYQADNYTDSVRGDVDPVCRSVADLQLTELDQETEQHQAQRC
jgi:hypothetical protein